jgi:hypothetical protein
MQERDPNGLAPSAPGAKLDDGKLRADLTLDGFSRALLAVAEVSTFGARKYSPGGWQRVPEGEQRYRAAGDRHRLARGFEPRDRDSHLLHLAHEAWNRLAELELHLRAQEAGSTSAAGCQTGTPDVAPEQAAVETTLREKPAADTPTWCVNYWREPDGGFCTFLIQAPSLGDALRTFERERPSVTIIGVFRAD